MQGENSTLEKKFINVISHTNKLKKEILRNFSTDAEKAPYLQFKLVEN